jgi:hypothetical protein
MKRVMNYSVVAIIMALLFYSCSNDDDNSSDSDAQQIAEIENNALNGLWKITNYNDSGQDETSDYNGYTFNFDANGVLTATNGSNVVTGTWSVTSSSSDDSNDDGANSDDSIDFNMFFSVSESSIFDDLVDDWEVSATSNNQINLFDISGGDGSTDVLVFSAI